MFPNDLSSSTYPDPTNPNVILGHSEVERRTMYFEILGNSVPESLIHLIKDCLHNNPSSRPTPEEIESRLQNLLHLEGMIIAIEVHYLALNSVLLKFL